MCYQGRSDGYISLGLSKDPIMGDDLTTNCVVTSNGRVDINTGEKLIERGVNTNSSSHCKVTTLATPETNQSHGETTQIHRME